MALLELSFASPVLAATPADAPPNIIVILADDLGYGDLGCYGAKGIKTPHCDRLAVEGLRFTDAHATASVCTPTRYAMLTGRYAWRKPGTGILPGDAALIVETNRVTLPGMLRQAGYATGVVGKWHLGLGKGSLDLNGDIKPGPLECGFDYSFIIPATGDRVPCVFIENHRVVNLDPADPITVNYKTKVGNYPTGRERPDLLRLKNPDGSHSDTIVNGISRIGFMSGGKSALWVDEEFPDVLTQRAIQFIEKHHTRPFFLYFPTHDIHEPQLPNPQFKGSSALGNHGDVVQQFDWQVGQILAALDRLKLASNTLVIVSSDNGGIRAHRYDYPDFEKYANHPSSGQWRGFKSSLYEGGHRVPCLVRWPGRVQAGATCDDLIGLVDMVATTAELTGQTLKPEDAPDSVSFLPALLGKPGRAAARDHLVLQNNGQAPLALRLGQWKYIETGKGELYDLAADPGETNNLATARPEKRRELSALLNQVRADKKARPAK